MKTLLNRQFDLTPFLGEDPDRPTLGAVHINLDRNRVEASDGRIAAIVPLQISYQQYPDVEMAMPKEGPKASIHLSADYLAKIANWAQQNAGEDKAVKIDFYSEIEAARFTVHLKDGDATILLMPMRERE